MRSMKYILTFIILGLSGISLAANNNDLMLLRDVPVRMKILEDQHRLQVSFAGLESAFTTSANLSLKASNCLKDALDSRQKVEITVDLVNLIIFDVKLIPPQNAK